MTKCSEALDPVVNSQDIQSTEHAEWQHKLTIRKAHTEGILRSNIPIPQIINCREKGGKNVQISKYLKDT